MGSSPFTEESAAECPSLKSRDVVMQKRDSASLMNYAGIQICGTLYDASQDNYYNDK